MCYPGPVPDLDEEFCEGCDNQVDRLNDGPFTEREDGTVVGCPFCEDDIDD